MARVRSAKYYNGLKVVPNVAPGYEEPPTAGYSNGELVQIQASDNSSIAIQGGNFGINLPGTNAKVQFFRLDDATGEEVLVGSTDLDEANEILSAGNLEIFGEGLDPQITIVNWIDTQIQLTVNAPVQDTAGGILPSAVPKFPYSIKVVQGKPISEI